ncbi:MAG TPA: hypothetical protein VJ692_05385 [Nitrospiraceae bacterium]|nr:hypothetical protein [Nitrospiraceae bacterium]
MQGPSAGTMIVDTTTLWGLWFAREPEPHSEKEFDDPEEPVVLGSPEPSKPPHLRPWLLILLLLMVAGGTYFASDPSLVLDLIGQGPPSPAPAPPVEPPVARAPAKDSTPSALAPEPPPSPPLPVTATPGPAIVPTPRFSEGQRVAIQPDATSPTGSVPLSADAEGTRPGPTVRSGSTLTVLDAELQGAGWMYSVRADSGAKGWIAESRLAGK